MARRRSAISQTRGILYGLAKVLGDINSISKGPGAIGKRVARKAAGKVLGRGIARLFK